MELLDDDIDLEELSRRKRNADHTRKDLQESYEEISSIGELLYPHDTETSVIKSGDQEYSNLGELLYPSGLESNKLNEDEEKMKDYSIDPLENDDDNDFLGQPNPTDYDHLENKEGVSIFNKFYMSNRYSIHMQFVIYQ